MQIIEENVRPHNREQQIDDDDEADVREDKDVDRSERSKSVESSCHSENAEEDTWDLAKVSEPSKSSVESKTRFSLSRNLFKHANKLKG